ncbi:MAG: carboxypeptidase regulatory-like domain-containing protein, partial [Spirochaetales bacterium]|nr:carboxypeptidase regulatory-like domain-containing protein [Candidatus Physcosoma equi]
MTPTIKGKISIPSVAGLENDDIWVKITADDFSPIVTKVKSDGTFVFTGLDEGKNYNICFSSIEPTNASLKSAGEKAVGSNNGYGGWLSDVTAVLGEGRDVGSIKMSPLGTIRGKVTYSGLEEHFDIMVYVPGTSYMAMTNGDGSFAITNVPQGLHQLRYTAAGYVSQMKTQVYLHSDSDTESPTLDVSPVTLVANGGDVVGSVVLSGRKSHEGISILLKEIGGKHSYTLVTDATGAFSFADCYPASYTLQCTKEGFDTFVSSSPYTVTAGGRVVVSSITLAATTVEGTLNGRVICSDYVNNAGITVEVLNTIYHTMTDTLGFFSIKLPMGVYDGIRYSTTCHSVVTDINNIVILGDEVTNLQSLVTLYPSHNYTLHVAASQYLKKPGSCTSAAEYWYSCSGCGMASSTEFFVEGSPLDHPYGQDWSCDEENHWMVSTCEHHLTKDYGPHVWGTPVQTKDPSCTEDGTLVYSCLTCGYQKSVVINATGHSYSNTWSSSVDEHWHSAICEHSELKIDVASHSFDAGVVSRVGTCLVKEQVKYTCMTCGYEKFVETQFGDHAWGNSIIEKEATCLEAGVMSSLCLTCGTNSDHIPIPATGHSYSESWISDEYQHWHLAICEHSDVTSPKNNHNWNDGQVLTSSSCTVPGSILYTCLDCGYEKNASLPLAEHTWNEGHVNSSSTCVTAGSITFTCTNCPATKTEELPLGSHLYEEAAVGDDITYQCSVCSSVLHSSDSSPILSVSENGVVTLFSSVDRESFTHLIIPEMIGEISVSSVASDAFLASTNVTSIQIPQSVVRIGENAFKDNTTLEMVTYLGTVAQWNAIEIAGHAFENTPCLYAVTCSDGVVELRHNLQWSDAMVGNYCSVCGTLVDSLLYEINAKGELDVK